MACSERNYKYGIVACHNGSIYQYKCFGSLNDASIDTFLNIYEKKEYRSINSLYTDEDILKAHKDHMDELIHNLASININFKEVLHYGRYSS